MVKLYELLAKVGTNPKLRAWAMEQLIKLKHLKPRYKKSYFHDLDLNKVKDIRNPNWQVEKIAKEKAYNLKNKIVDLTKAKDKVKWNKIERQQDKDDFYGVTGQVNTWLKKIKDEGIAWEAEIAKKDAWFNKLMKAKVKGDPRAKKILDNYFKKQDKDFADKITPFKPKKAEGGRIGFDDGGPSQKEIDKGIAAIEKLKSSLMPESYEELIKIYKDKQKDLNIDIMESAGGLGQMLGEGGVAGHSPLAREQLPSQRRKKHIPHKFPKLGEGGRIGMMYGGDPGFAFSYGGSWADWKDNHASEMPLMDYINQKLPKARHPFSDAKYNSGGPVHDLDGLALSIFQKPYAQLTSSQQSALDNFKPEAYEPIPKAEGGRVPMLAGGLLRTGIMEILYPLLKGTWKGTLGSYRDLLKRLGKHEVRGDVDKFMPTIKSSRAINLAKSVREGLLSKIKGYKEGFVGAIKSRKTGDQVEELKYLIKETKKDLKHIDDFILKKQSGAATKHAEGGRIGMAKGDTPSEAYLRDLFYDGGWDAKGDIGLHEFMHGPIGANEWFKHNNKAEGGRIGFKKGGKGGIGDLMGELYRLFEIGPLLGSPELVDLIQKIPFEKGGRAGFKKGDKVDLDRRMILKGIGALSALPMFKWLKFAKTKPVKDISVKLKSWIDDSDEMTDYGPQAVGRWAGNFDISSLTPQGVTILKKLFGKSVKTVTDKAGKVTASINSTLDDAAGYVDDIIKKGKGNIDFKYLDDTGGALGSVEGTLASYAKTFGKNSKIYKEFLKKSKKMTEKQKIKYELADDYGSVDQTGAVDDVIDLIYPGKGEGGSVGYPPLQPTQKPQGPFYKTNNPNEAFKEILRQSIGSGITRAPLPGKFSLDVPYGQYGPNAEVDFGVGFNTDPRSSGFGAGYGVNLDGNDTMGAVYNSPGGTFSMGVNKQEGSDPQWRFEKKWKFGGPKNMKQGGKVWQPKSAPKLTTTIPPERGPTPQGLTYLTGDDIVQNIGQKHGRYR